MQSIEFSQMSSVTNKKAILRERKRIPPMPLPVWWGYPILSRSREHPHPVRWVPPILSTKFSRTRMGCPPPARSGWGPPPPAGQIMDCICCSQYTSCGFMQEDFLVLCFCLSARPFCTSYTLRCGYAIGYYITVGWLTCKLCLLYGYLLAHFISECGFALVHITLYH